MKWNEKKELFTHASVEQLKQTNLWGYGNLLNIYRGSLPNTIHLFSPIVFRDTSTLDLHALIYYTPVVSRSKVLAQVSSTTTQKKKKSDTDSYPKVWIQSVCSSSLSQEYRQGWFLPARGNTWQWQSSHPSTERGSEMRVVWVRGVGGGSRHVCPETVAMATQGI